MKTFTRVTIIIWTLAFVGGLVTGKSAFSQDCKYKLVVKLDDNGKILSSKTEYVCKESKPILVLPPNTYTETKKVRARTKTGHFKSDDPSTPDIDEAWEIETT